MVEFGTGHKAQLVSDLTANNVSMHFKCMVVGHFAMAVFSVSSFLIKCLARTLWYFNVKPGAEPSEALLLTLRYSLRITQGVAVELAQRQKTLQDWSPHDQTSLCDWIRFIK